MDEIFAKLRSDRLWALLAFGALVVSNAMFDLGLDVAIGDDPAPLTGAMYATIAFILGKSVRGTVGGSLLESGLSMLTPVAGKLPDIELTAETPAEDVRVEDDGTTSQR